MLGLHTISAIGMKQKKIDKLFTPECLVSRDVCLAVFQLKLQKCGNISKVCQKLMIKTRIKQ